MILENKNEKEKIVIANCNCGCNQALQITKFNYADEEDIDEDYYLSITAGLFSERQRGIFKTIGHRIKLAFKMLLGKEYLLCDIILNKQEIKDFIKSLENIQK